MNATMERKPKAADIDDEEFLLLMLLTFQRKNMWTNTWDLEQHFTEFPYKVLLAKARQLLKRDLISGCGCGCRGDFELTPKGMDYLLERGNSKGPLKRYARGRYVKWEPRHEDKD